MASKYAGVLDALQPLPPELPAYQQKIDAIKTELRAASSMPPETLAKEYAKLRAVKDALKDDLSAVQERITAVEQMLVESLDADEPGWGTYGAGPTTVKMANGATVAVQYEPTAKVEDKEAFRLWCVTPADVCMTCGGARDAIEHWVDAKEIVTHPFTPGGGLEKSLQLWPSTTEAIVKERLLAGQDAPQGVAAYVKAKIVLRGAK